MNVKKMAGKLLLVILMIIVTALPAMAHDGPDESIPDSHGAVSAATVSTIVETSPNPDLVAGCGLRIAFVLDESGSIDSAGQAQVIAASQGFLLALAGTGSEAAIVGFATTADTPVNYTAINAASIAPTGAFGQYLATTGPGAQYHDGRLGTYTNWEAAFQQVNNLPTPPDLVVFMTDGYPNTVVGGSGGAATTSAAINAAAVRANVTKANGGNAGNGSHIFAVGVGSGVSVDNMKPVLDGAASVAYDGSNFNSADYITGSFSTLLDDLQRIATALCGGTITVEKIFDPDGNPQTTNDRYPVEGWLFELSVASPASAPANLATGPDGKVNFEIDFGGDIAATANLSEQLAQGQSLMVAGCVGANDNGTLSGNGISGIVVGPSDIAKCSFVNTDGPSAIDVTKTANRSWVSEPGGLVVFEFVVTNQSLGDTVTINSLYDDVLGDLHGQGTCSVPQVLLVGDVYSCAVQVFVAGNPGDVHRNVFTASGVDDDGYTVEDSDDAQVSIVDVPSSMTVFKNPSVSSLPEPGTVVHFTIGVQNTSTTDVITIMSLVDDVYGPLGSWLSCLLPTTIAPGGWFYCVFDASVTGNAGDVHVNTVTVTAVDDDGVGLEESASAEVLITDVPSSMTVVKTASPTFLPEPGGLVTFTLVVTNTSAVDAITITGLFDSVYGDVNGWGDCTNLQSLQPGDAYTCSFVEQVTGNAGDKHYNVITVTAVDDDGAELEAKDDALVRINNVESGMAVNKTASPASVSEPGGTVTFTVVVQNTSAVDDVLITRLDDSVYGDLNGKGDCVTLKVLPPGGTYTCFFVEQVTGNAGAVHTNVVTAYGLDDDDQPLKEQDDASVTVTDVPSSIYVSKTASPTSVPETGADVVYEVTAKNTSLVDPVTIDKVVDNVFGDVSISCLPQLPATILPGESVSCIFVRFVAGNAGGNHTNVVTAYGLDDDGQEVVGEDSANVVFEDVLPEVRVKKTASVNSVMEPGEVVSFLVQVSNLGLEQVTLASLYDSVFGDLNGQGNCSVPQILPVGSVYGCRFEVVVSGTGGTVHNNVVTVAVEDDDGNVALGDDDEDVVIVKQPTGLEQEEEPELIQFQFRIHLPLMRK